MPIYRRRRVPKDPHWIEARYEGECGSRSCSNRIERGTRVFHYPNSNTTYCTTCSDDASRRAAAELADEDFFAAR
jgi:hypothetical protein